MFAKMSATVMLLLCVGSIAYVAAANPEPVMQQRDQVINMLRTAYSNKNRANAADPERVDICFEYYTRMESETSTKYNKAYMSCAKKSAADRSKLAERNAVQRADITYRENNVCSVLQSCQSANVPLEFFKCTAKASDTSALQDISMESQRIAAEIEKETQRISDDEKICVVAAKSEYNQEMSKVMNDLERCLNEGWEPPAEN